MQLITVKDYELMTAFGRELKTSCIVKPRDKKSTIAYSENQDGSPGVPYKPVVFPKGLWSITVVEWTTNPLMAPVFIGTDAHQLIDQWELDEDGKYKGPVQGELPDTTRQVMDYGYGCHFDAQFEETWGCFHLYSADDAHWLAAEIMAAGIFNCRLQVM